MKKFFAFLLSAAMLFGLVAVPAVAEGEVTITVATVDEVTPGTDVLVDINIGGADYEAHTLTFNVLFNSEMLTYKSSTPGEVWNSMPMDAMRYCNSEVAGQVGVGIVCPTDAFSGHGKLVTLKFHVAENCTENQPLTIDISLMSYAPNGVDPVDVPVIGTNGAINLIEIEPPTPEFITEIEIEGFTAPVWGEHPDYTVNVPAGAHYSIDYVDWNWWNDSAEEGDVLDASQTFNHENYVYYMYFEITPEEGYTIIDDAVVKVNGDPNVIENAGLSESYGYYWAYTIDYTVTDPGTEPPTPPAGDLDEALNVPGGTIHFESTGEYPWTVVNEGDRSYAASSNAGVGSSESVLTAVVEVESNKAIAFDFKAWGEGSGTPWDKCIFAIDGNPQFTYGALANDWTAFECNVPAGTHTLTWTYSKDSSVNPNGDFFAIDNVEIKEREEVPVNNELDDALNVPGGDIHFASTGTYPWIVVDEGSRVYAMSGNQGVNSSESVLTATVTAEAGDIVQFEFMAWGEGTSTFWDHCDFYVDGTRVLYYGAYDNQWETFIYVLTAGEHELKWSFTKDSSLNGDGDFFKVDNVYVGEPVHVESITAENVEVPVNRTALINYTVLPAEAANKAVTFECADTSIATVSENGLVVGVAEGTTTITITSVDMPEISVTIEVNVIDTGITAAYFYGICSYDMAESLTDNWVTFADYDPSAVTGIAGAPDSYAAAYAYGNVYGFTTGGDFYTAPFSSLGSYSVVASGTYTAGTIVSMAYNYANGMMYGLDSSNNALVAIDIDSGYAEVVATFTAEDLIAIAIDYNGVGYAVSFDSNLYRFDCDTAACTVIGSTGCSVNYVQDLCYDYNNGDLYWAQIYSQTNNGLYRLDKNTGYAENLGYIGPSGMEICGMFVVPNYEPDKPTDIPVTGVSIMPTEVDIRVGDTANFTAVVYPINASNKNVEWAVDADDVIAVDQNGTVIGLAVGTAMVFVTTEDGAHTAFATVNVLPPLGNSLYGFFFETNPLNDGWTFVDYDGDGYNWGWDNSNYTPYEGSGLIYSQSYDNPTYSALNPDNWAISPALILPNEAADVTLYAKGQDPDYAAEVFAIYAGTTPNPADMVKVGGDFTATGDYVQYSANLNAFLGQTVYVAIRHYNVSDMFILNVDQVEFWGTGTIDGAHTLTINYVYEDGSVAAPAYNGMYTEGAVYSVTSPDIAGYIPDIPVVTGTMGSTDVTVEVTYHEDPNRPLVGYFFETSPFNEGWQFIDDDGDGFNWIWQQDYSNPPYCTAYEGEGLIYSCSYDNDTGSVLYPDNWAVSPAVTLPAGSAYVTFYAEGQDANYAAEHFAVYAGTSDNIYDMMQISQEYVATGEYVQYRVDLGAFLGQTVYIAIRHFNVSDMFMLNIDQFEVFGSDGGATPSEPTPSEPTPSEPTPSEPTPSEPTPSEPTPSEPTPSEPTPAEPTVVFTVESKSDVKPGDTITLNFTVSSEDEYHADILAAYISWDANVLTLTNYEAGDFGGHADPLPGEENNAIVVYASDITGNGVIGKLTFTVGANFKEATVVTPNVDQFGYLVRDNEELVPIEYTLVNGVVTPASTTPDVPHTGAIGLVGLGVIAIASGAGVVLFRRKED